MVWTGYRAKEWIRDNYLDSPYISPFSVIMYIDKESEVHWTSHQSQLIMYEQGTGTHVITIDYWTIDPCKHAN